MGLCMTDICRRYILTGGPGAGKTTVLDGLANRGFLCVPDHARAIIRSRLNRGLSPRPDPTEFKEAVFKMHIDAYISTHQHRNPVFFDRGLFDSLYSLCKNGKVTMDQVEQYMVQYPFNATVFFFGPWADIYVKDAERDHSFSHAVAVAEITTRWYRELGFALIEVPKLSPEERVTYVLNHVEAGG